MKVDKYISSYDIEIRQKLRDLQEAITEVESNPDFMTRYITLHPEKTVGKTFKHFVLDDLMSAWLYAAKDIELRELEIAHLLLLAQGRDGQEVSQGDMYQTLSRHRQIPENDTIQNTAPRFLTLFHEQGTLNNMFMLMSTVKERWNDAAKSLAKALEEQGDNKAAHLMKEYIEHTNAVFDRPHITTPTPGTEIAPYHRGSFKSQDHEAMMQRAEASGMHEAALQRFEKDLRRLDDMSSSSDSYQSRIQPLLTLLDLPWKKRAELVGNINETKSRMDQKHAGLDKVKDVISEQIAVQMRTGNGNGKILCFDGPPGIGKTSLAQTIAYATGRPLVRFALGGVHDAHEIRGHRSTYVNATPGRIVNAMIQAGVKNPIILLDEIDKVGHTSKNASDMEAALLEVLDPEQNSAFKDTFLDTEIDLSEVLFIATSNDKSQIMPALQNRMEVIDLPAYTSAQKLDIALKHLLPKQMAKNGVSENNLAISSDAIKLMIEKYVREPGVRELERTIEKICRKAALQLESGSTPRVIVHDGNLSDFLGKAHNSSRVLTRENAVGVVNGLGVSGNTGSVLPFEVIKMPSNGRFSIQRTGQMRDMMKESVDIISSWIRANSEKHDIKPEDLNKLELHVNAIGSMPKDGPSAGTAITSACLSALTGRALRADVAMTGEMTLGGRVRAIGGTIAKLEGAMKDGMTTVLIPKANVDDLSEASDEILSKLRIIPVETIDQVLEHVFVQKSPLQLQWDDADSRDTSQKMPLAAGPTKPLLLPAPSPASI